MPLPTVNVVRYSALAGGIVYGALHRRTLQKRADAAAEEAERNKLQGWADEGAKLFKEKFGNVQKAAEGAITTFSDVKDTNDLQKWLETALGGKSS